MNLKYNLLGVLLLGVFFSCTTQKSEESSGLLTPVPFNEVKLEDSFWLPRLKTQAETLVPFALDKTIPAVEKLKQAAKFLKGDTTDLPKPHRFVSSDLYKVMEGAAYLLKIERNPELEARLDEIIDVIASAQQEDGYLYVAHITGVAKNHASWGSSGMGDKPYSWVVHSHELYNIGHMYEGAIAYFQATGKRKWLDVAEKSAQHVNRVFFEGDPNYNNGKPVNQAPGHEEMELALVKLYRATKNELYLEMAKKFLDIRGKTFVPDGEGCMAPEYAQQHKPLVEQSRAVGHAVRAAYLYAGMADVDALSEQPIYRDALDRIWHNIVDTKMHITGGLGAIHGIEGFGPEFVLPNKDAYNETCAAVGNVFFNYRMFLAEKNAKFLDVAEVALYNNSLAGVNIEGNKFFYVNPLEADGVKPFNHGNKGRSPWFGCACCPANIARLIPQVSGMMYAHSGNDIYCSFYAGNATTLQLDGGKVSLKQETNYPFEGHVTLTVNPEKKNQQIAVKIRIPSWATSQFVPGALYQFENKNFKDWKIKVNGKEVSASLDNGFATVERSWNDGDKLELMLPMTVRFNRADERIEADQKRIAVTRGPLVYCIEEPDNDLVAQAYYIDKLPKDDEISEETFHAGLLKDVVKVNLPIQSVGATTSQATLIPYYAWNNRGDASMIVWIPDNEKLAEENVPEVTKNVKFEKIIASHTFKLDKVEAIGDGKQPSKSFDTTIPRWTSWAEKGKEQWVEIALKEERTIRSISVYWYDDQGGVQVPQSWSLEYYKDGRYMPFELYVTDSYNSFKDQYNMVHPANELSCDRIRILMTPKANAAVGILDVEIDYEK
ncbi:hypothetical protein EYV94_17150 [Puteibacter caeruleilacunae]|nr:hypothetical protein EYV94_17150 [Puteibacter caeruleilacunae]